MDAHILGVTIKVNKSSGLDFFPLGICLSCFQFTVVPSSEGILWCFVQLKEAPAISFKQCELVWMLQMSKESNFPIYVSLCIDFSDLNVFPYIVFCPLTPKQDIIIYDNKTCCEMLRACQQFLFDTLIMSLREKWELQRTKNLQMS